MKLAAYLKETGESDERFAKRIQLSIFAIRKYKSGARMPRKEHVIKIKKVTKEQVTEADWYS